MQSWPKSKLGKVGVGSNIAQNHLPSLQEVMPVHYLPHIMKSWSTVKLGKVIMCPYLDWFILICSNNHFGPDLTLFICMFPTFSFIFLYLATFSLIWLLVIYP